MAVDLGNARGKEQATGRMARQTTAVAVAGTRLSSGIGKNGSSVLPECTQVASALADSARGGLQSVAPDS